MTQLVAAICDDGQKVITVSDRMVSSGDMTLTFEHSDRKAQAITSHSAILIAGTMHEPDLIRDLRLKAKGKDRIRDIADTCVGLYQELRVNHIQDEILRRNGLSSFEEYQRKQKILHDSMILEINDAVKKYDLGLTLMLVGVDNEAHILHIGNPGAWRSFDNLGYCTVGMGERHADNVFAWYRYSRNMPLRQALHIAFEAKKKAEVAGGVGQASDIMIIAKQGLRIVKEGTVKQLEDIYNSYEAKDPRRELRERITGLKVQYE